MWNTQYINVKGVTKLLNCPKQQNFSIILPVTHRYSSSATQLLQFAQFPVHIETLKGNYHTIGITFPTINKLIVY